MKKNKIFSGFKFSLAALLLLLFCVHDTSAQQIPADSLKNKDTVFTVSPPSADSAINPVEDVSSYKVDAKQKVLFGLASFYSNKFEGRKTANGEKFSQKKLTAACNVLPLGTWIKVTNLKNGKSVIVRTNDRLHPRMKRLVDLTKAAAVQLNYLSSGVTRVKVEVVKKPTKKNKK